MSELLPPRADAGVAAQVIVVGVLVNVALWRAWSRPDLRLLAWGSLSSCSP